MSIVSSSMAGGAVRSLFFSSLGLSLQVVYIHADKHFILLTNSALFSGATPRKKEFTFDAILFLIFHSDRGVQYADMAFRKLCAQHRILRSMSRKGDCWDNAVAESFFKTLKSEAIFGISLLELNFAQSVLF